MQLAFWAVLLAAGILAGILLGQAAAWVLAGLAFAACVACLLLRVRSLGLACLVVACGIWLGHREVFLAQAPAQLTEDVPVEIVGQIVAGSDVADQPGALASEPQEGEGASHKSVPKARCHLRVGVRTVDGQPVTARLSLLVLGGVPDLAPGDWIRFTSRLYVPRGFSNPGLPDARLLARGQGIDLLATVPSPTELHPLSGPASVLSYARRWAFRLRQAMARAINRRLSDPAAGFVRTMVLGERTDVPVEVEDGFRAAGATHVLSVSGLHLAVVVAMVFQALRRLIACFPSWTLRIPPKVLASALSLPACAFYTLLTGEAVATVRSAVMASMVLVSLSAYLLYRVGEGDHAPAALVRPQIAVVAKATATLGAIILILGTMVTGSGPHSGDAATPRFGFDPRTISWLHAAAVMLFAGLVVAVLLAVQLTATDPRPRRAWHTVLGITVLQGLVGYAQYLTGLPDALVMVHMLGASLLAVSLTYGVLSLRER